jgi:hypothetical protein
MAIEALEGISDQELFDQANADEAPADTPLAEPADAPVEQPDQTRDEQGRFAGKPEDEPEAPAAIDPPAKTPVDDNAPQVPSWRVREINEEKRQIVAENERIKAELAQLRQAQPQPQRQQPAAVEPPTRPDPLLDPEGYANAIRQELREEALNDRREESLIRARESNQQEFDEAYAAAQKAVDPALKARMQSSRDPGKTLLQWHREEKTRAEVGNDLTAFREREQERLLSDPAFLAKAIEKARGAAQPSTQPGTRPAVSLPPSLTRATNASADGSADDNDVSDEGLWRHANS